MKKILLFTLLFTSSLAFTVGLNPNYIRATAGEKIPINLQLNVTETGAYTLKIDGPGLIHSQKLQMLAGQSFEQKFTLEVPSSGDFTVVATVTFGNQARTAQAKVSVVKVLTTSNQINQTMYELENQLTELYEQAISLREDFGSLSKLDDIRERLGTVNETYKQGRVMAAEQELNKIQNDLVEASIMIKTAKQKEGGINFQLLIVGILIILVAVGIVKFMK